MRRGRETGAISPLTLLLLLGLLIPPPERSDDRRQQVANIVIIIVNIIVIFVTIDHRWLGVQLTIPSEVSGKASQADSTGGR